LFLLNNIYDRAYREIYPDIKNVVFDISSAQLRNAKNKDWLQIGTGSIVCVVTSSRRVSTLYRVDEKFEAGVIDPSQGAQHVITGLVVGKLPNPADMTTLLTKYEVRHPVLPGNKFSTGFNVADLGDALDDLLVSSAGGESKTVSELKGVA
jgi:hypothetical protein